MAGKPFVCGRLARLWGLFASRFERRYNGIIIAVGWGVVAVAKNGRKWEVGGQVGGQSGRTNFRNWVDKTPILADVSRGGNLTKNG